MTEEPKKPTVSLAEINKMIEDKITALADKLGTVTPSPKPVDAKDPSPEGGVSGAVRREIEKIRAREAAEAEQKSIKDEIVALKTAAAEKPPVERRRVHKIMGWGE